jgi:hypothetical protein
MLTKHFPLNQYPSITLDTYQIESGAFQATNRDSESRRRGWKDSRGLTSNQTYYSYLGSVGEVAAHLLLDVPFSYSINKPMEPDLISNDGTAFDVKCSKGTFILYVPQKHVERGHNFLFLNSSDAETFYLLGYIMNKDVANYSLSNPGDRFNSDGSPALVYTIPITDLHHFPANEIHPN